MRVAAIDVGSNSIHLMVAEQRDGGYAVLDDEKVVTRLAQGLEPGGEFSEQKLLEAAEAIHRLLAIAHGYEIDRVRLIATAAVREAANSQKLIDLVANLDGVALEIIDTNREAGLAFRSVAAAFDLGDQRVAVCDVGGASTELVLATDGVIESVSSLSIGAVRLTDRHGPCDDAGGLQHRVLRHAVREAFRISVPRPEFPPAMLVGVGGTFTSLGRMVLAARHGLEASAALDRPVRGLDLLHDEVRHLADDLRRMPVVDRARVPGINPDRADIIVAGLEIIDRAMRRLGVNRLRIHDRGIRDGLVLEMLGGEQGAHRRINRVASARAFAQRCRVEGPQNEHVAELAVGLFDRLAELFPGDWADPPARELLESAALVHNVGYLIGYSKHHKHSYHLIVHSRLPGFTRQELELVAQIARYHRRAKPKLTHAPYAALSDPEREVVCKLGGILRIADGLNRTHRKTTERAELGLDGTTLRFCLFGDEDGISVWGAQRKKDLFEQAFGVETEFELAGPGSASRQESGT